MKNALITTCVLFGMTLLAPGAGLIFDDFNVGEGHFNRAPNYSGTSTMLATSTADWSMLAPGFEGDGYEHLVLFTNGNATARCRFLSGTGSPANNTSFTTSATTTDGWIGYYVRTTTSGWTTGINLDSANNVATNMLGSTLLPLIADGEWHLYEWDLDGTTWGPVTSIAGYANMGVTPSPNTWTIDSIYFYSTAAPGASATFDLDFVAKSDFGSVASVVPEPSTLALGLIGGLIWTAVLRRRSNS